MMYHFYTYTHSWLSVDLRYMTSEKAKVGEQKSVPVGVLTAGGPRFVALQQPAKSRPHGHIMGEKFQF